MTLGVIATITVVEGKNQEFESVFSDLAKQVLSQEPGVLLYALHRSKSKPQVYKVMEQYRSAQDLKVHQQTDYFLAANKALATVVAAAPEIELLDVV